MALIVTNATSKKVFFTLSGYLIYVFLKGLSKEIDSKMLTEIYRTRP
jgi:hypothetical protein